MIWVNRLRVRRVIKTRNNPLIIRAALKKKGGYFANYLQARGHLGLKVYYRECHFENKAAIKSLQWPECDYCGIDECEMAKRYDMLSITVPKRKE